MSCPLSDPWTCANQQPSCVLPCARYINFKEYLQDDEDDVIVEAKEVL